MNGCWIRDLWGLRRGVRRSSIESARSAQRRAKNVYVNRLPELTDWDAMPFSAAEKRRRREAERNAALRGNPDALEKRAREAARKKRQREAAEVERARKRRRKGELRVANSISSAIAAAATNKALSDAAALARYDRLLFSGGGAEQYQS